MSDEVSKTMRPNILMLFPDQHRGDWVGFEGEVPVRTPELDALAARGTVCPRAICPSPLCAPARAVIATGDDYDRNPVKRNEHDLPLASPTLYRALRDGGYHVATCGKLDLLKERKDWGVDGRHEVDGRSLLEALGFSDGIDNAGKHDSVIAHRRGLPEPYFAYLQSHELLGAHLGDFERRYSPSIARMLGAKEADYDRGDGSRPAGNYTFTSPTPLPDHAYIDNWIAGNGINLLERAPADRPWFLAVNFNGPHEPMDVTSRMHERWRDVEFPLVDGMADLPPEGHQRIRRNYAAMIENIDAQVGRFVGWLADNGQLENTVVVYSSDHGEMLGEHRAWEKHVPWQPSVHVPLVFAGPGIARGVSIDDPVSTVDLAATLLELAGAAPLGRDSRSLAGALGGSGNGGREFAFSALGSWRLAFDGRYKLVAGFDSSMTREAMMNRSECDIDGGPFALYDLEADPRETVNLVDREPGQRRRLEEALRAWIEAPV